MKNGKINISQPYPIFKNVTSASLIALSYLAISPCYADVTPATVEEYLSPGGSVSIAKTVDTPSLPPSLDLYLMVDLSSSYNNDLPNIRNLDDGLFDSIRVGVADSQFGVGSFVDFPFYPWGSLAYGDYAYQRNLDFTTDKLTWTSTIDGLSTRSGGDGRESQYTALYQAATGNGLDVEPAGNSDGDIAAGLNPGWRLKSTKVIAITTDAQFHVPTDLSCTHRPDCYSGSNYPGPSRDDTVAALKAAGIKVLALKAPGSGAEMDYLAAETGGTVQSTTSTSSNIAAAILAGLDELPTTVSPVPVGCGPLTVGFIPETVTVTSGDTASFTETIAVPNDSALEGSTINCTVEFHDEYTNLLGTQTLTVMVRDVSPPQSACLKGVNPAGNTPRATKTNEDGFYLLSSLDNTDINPDIYIIDNGSGKIFGPFADGTNIKYVQAPGAPVKQRAGTGEVDWFITGNGDFEIYSIDESGNESSKSSCLVPPPPK